MNTLSELKNDIKKLIIENLMLQIPADELTDDRLLFGPGSLGLDSVDALQLVVALDKQYGLKIPDPVTARKILQNISTIAQAVNQHMQSSNTEGKGIRLTNTMEIP